MDNLTNEEKGITDTTIRVTNISVKFKRKSTGW